MGLMVFDFEDKAVRAFERDGQEWFVAKDVCGCLGIVNAPDAIRKIPDDEKQDVNLNTIAQSDGIRPGNPNAIAINEAGLYRLIFRSDKPEAERLKRFVFHEVLPQLRRTGAYAPEPDFDVMREKLFLVKETRLTMGRKAAAALWRELGLPVADEAREALPERSGMLGHVRDFIEDCLVEDRASEVTAAAVFKRYEEWAAANSAPYIIFSSFGKFLQRAGIQKRRSNGTIYTGVRIRHPSAALA